MSCTESLRCHIMTKQKGQNNNLVDFASSRVNGEVAINHLLKMLVRNKFSGNMRCLQSRPPTKVSQ